jgi:hypothetical protein
MSLLLNLWCFLNRFPRVPARLVGARGEVLAEKSVFLCLRKRRGSLFTIVVGGSVKFRATTYMSVRRFEMNILGEREPLYYKDLALELEPGDTFKLVVKNRHCIGDN